MNSIFSRFGTAAFIAAGILLVATFCALIAVPLWSNDLWWHLATGRHLLETHRFLTADPFSLAGNDISPGRTSILNGYWLAQIVMYGSYELLGEWGVILLRAGLLTAVPLLLLVYGARRQLSPWALLLAAILTSWTFLTFTAERPNLFTILFVPTLICLLDRVGLATKQNPLHRYALEWTAAVGLLMLVWANLHGGFLLGSVLIGLYLTGETAKKFLLRHPIPGRSLLTLWLCLGVALLVTLLTPVGSTIYLEFITSQGGVIQEKTAEFLNPFAAAANGVVIYPYFLTVILFLLLLIRHWRQIDLTEAIAGLFLLVISFTAFRYLPLFVGGVALFLTKELSREKEVFPALNKALPPVVVLIMVTTIAWNGQAYARKLRLSSFTTPVEAGLFPERAADFLNREHLTGILFNHYNWGGYLAWRGATESRVFIDGRALNMSLFHAYTRILWLPEEMRGLLDRYSVNIIVMPRLNPSTGELYALTDFLYQAPEWMLVYRDETAMILVRKGNFLHMTAQRELSKRLIYEDALTDVERRLRTGESGEYLLKAKESAMRHLYRSP
jgi:hypothetical protein